MVQRRIRAIRRGRLNPGNWSQAAFVLGAMSAVLVLGTIILWGFTLLSPKPDDTEGASWLYDVARSAIAALGVLTIGGGAAIAYRRQRSLEASHMLDVDRHLLTEWAGLHERYQQAAAQLGHDEPIIRIAGVYALEALANEWAALDEGDQRDVCIELLCGYLRSNRGVTRPADGQPPTMDEPEMAVRATIVMVIGRHLHDATDVAEPGDWSDRRFDFAGAHFGNVLGFRHARFHDDVTFEYAHFYGVAWLQSVQFCQDVDFSWAQFYQGAGFAWMHVYGRASFNEAHFYGDVDLMRANFRLAVGITMAQFDQGAVFSDVHFYDGAQFTNASFRGPVVFDSVHLLGPLDLAGVKGSASLSGVLLPRELLTESLVKLGAEELPSDTRCGLCAMALVYGDAAS